MHTRKFKLSISTLALSAVVTTGLVYAAPVVGVGAVASASASTARVGDLALLTDPFLQLQTKEGVSVVWMTEFVGSKNVVLVGEKVDSLSESELTAAAAGTVIDGVRVVSAETTKLSRVGEDSGSSIANKPTAEQGIVDRDVWRHEAKVTGLRAGKKVPYRVVSTQGEKFGASGTFKLSPAPVKGQSQKILLTSDHQAMINTPANLQIAKETVGDIDQVFLAGDLVNIPDRASEWFDDSRGSGFFPVLQGRGGRVGTNGKTYTGAPIVQEAPLFPAVGNHEVQGRIDGATGLNPSFNAPVPKDVAEREYRKVAATVNPSADPKVKAKWIEDNSYSTTTYEEIFSLPESASGGEKYYATTVGDVRLISLYSTRIWRGTIANPDVADRNTTSRYQESKNVLDKPLEQGYGEHVFESLEHGSEQLKWLEQELESDEFKDARFRVVMLHEGPQGLGDNVMPVFAAPERIETRNAEGKLTGVRYEYRTKDNMLVHDLQPLLEDAGVDLVHNGHSHLWNRFNSKNGVNYLETSNTGNSYGAYHGLSGRGRPIPPAPWDASNYMAIGNPGGLKAIVPTVKPFTTAEGTPQPFIQSNGHIVFTVLDTGTNEVTSYVKDMADVEAPAQVFDKFTLGRTAAGLAVSPITAQYTKSSKVTVTTGSAIDAPVTLSVGGKVVARGDVTDGRAQLSLPAKALRPGRHLATVRVDGTKVTAPAATQVWITVSKANATLRATSVRPAKIKAKSTRAVVTVQVKSAASASGRVVITSAAGKQLGSAKVVGGRAVIRLLAFQKPGTQRIVIGYTGSDLVKSVKANHRIKVVRR